MNHEKDDPQRGAAEEPQAATPPSDVPDAPVKGEGVPEVPAPVKGEGAPAVPARPRRRWWLGGVFGTRYAATPAPDVPARVRPHRRWWRVSLFGGHMVIKLVAVVAMLAVVVPVSFLGWLALEPRELNFLEAPFARAAARAFDAEVAEIDSVVVFWNYTTPWRLVLEGKNIRLHSHAGAQLVELESITGYFSLGNYFNERPVVDLLRMQGLALTLQLEPDSTPVAHTDTDPDTDSGFLAAWLARRIDSLGARAPILRGDSTDLPPRVELKGVSLFLVDEQGNAVIPPVNADFNLAITPSGQTLEASVSFVRELGGAGSPAVVAAPADISVWNFERTQALDGTELQVLRFSNVRPEQWEMPMREVLEAYGFTLPSVLDRFADVALPLSGVVEARMRGGALAEARLSVSGGPGELHLDRLYEEPLDILLLQLEAVLEPDKQTPEYPWHITLTLEELLFGDVLASTTEASVRGTGTLRLAAGEDGGFEGVSDFDFVGEAEVADFALEDLRRFWPERAVRPARTWVLENLKAGRVPRATLQFAGERRDKDLDFRDLELEYDFADISLDYLQSEPPVAVPFGTARASADGFEFAFDEATSAGLAFGPGTVAIPFDNREWWLPRLEVEAEFRGLARTALDYLADADFLDAQVGIPPFEGIEGTTSGHFALALPLWRWPEREDIEVSVEATLLDYRWPRLVRGLELAGETARVNFAEGVLAADGDANVAGNPVRFDWSRDTRTALERLDAKVESFSLATPLPFSFPLATRLDGTFSGEFAMTSEGARRHADLKLDLTNADFAVAEIGWSKRAGEAASLAGRVEFEGDTLREVRALEFEHIVEDPERDGLRIRDGDFVFANDGELGLAVLAEAQLGGSRVRELSLGRSNEGAYSLVAGEIDTLFLGPGWRPLPRARADSVAEADAGADAGVDAAEVAEGQGEASSPREPGVPFRLELEKVGRIFFKSDAWVEDATLELERDEHGNWQSLLFEARLALTAEEEEREADVHAQGVQGAQGEGEPAGALPRPRLRIAYGEQADGGYKTEIHLHPMGASLRALGLTSGLDGGTLTGGGLGQGPWPAYAMPIKLDSEDFTLREVNAFAQLLSLVSLTGLLTALGGEGIAFSDLEAELVVEAKRIVVRDFFMKGESLGITAVGTTGLDGNQSDLGGVLVPARKIQGFFAKVPILGAVLTGGAAREGVFSFNYHARGALADPELSVNPVTGILPGIFRRLFGAGTPQPPETLPEAEPEFETEIAPEGAPEGAPKRTP